MNSYRKPQEMHEYRTEGWTDKQNVEGAKDNNNSPGTLATNTEGTIICEIVSNVCFFKFLGHSTRHVIQFLTRDRTQLQGWEADCNHHHMEPGPQWF